MSKIFLKYNTRCWDRWCKFHSQITNTCYGKIEDIEEIISQTGEDCYRDRGGEYPLCGACKQEICITPDEKEKGLCTGCLAQSEE
jgi:hypothetical protein